MAGRTTYAAIRYRTKGQPGGRELFRKLCSLSDEYANPAEPGPIAEAIPFVLRTVAIVAADAGTVRGFYSALAAAFADAAAMKATQG